MSRQPEDWAPEFAHITRVFPERLRELMGVMTLRELSSLAGVSTGTLTNWRKGRTVPDLCCLFSVCSVLDASIDYIIGLDADGAPRRIEDDTQPDAPEPQPSD